MIQSGQVEVWVWSPTKQKIINHGETMNCARPMAGQLNRRHFSNDHYLQLTWYIVLNLIYFY